MKLIAIHFIVDKHLIYDVVDPINYTKWFE